MSPLVLDGDINVGSILGIEGNTAAVTSADGFGSICCFGENSTFFGRDDGVEGGVETFFDKDAVVDGGGTIEKPW